MKSITYTEDTEKQRKHLIDSWRTQAIVEAVFLLFPSIMTLCYAFRVGTHDFTVRQPANSYTTVGIFGILICLTLLIFFFGIVFCHSSITPVGTFGVAMYILAVVIGTDYTYMQMSGGYRLIGYMGGIFWIILTIIGLVRFTKRFREQFYAWFPELDADVCEEQLENENSKN